MKKIILSILILIVSAVACEAKQWHFLFIAQETTYQGYPCWIITGGPTTVYFVRPTTAIPEEVPVTVRRIKGIEKTVGSYNLIYYVTSNENEYNFALQTNEIAGWSDSYGNDGREDAITTMYVWSLEGYKVHSTLPSQAAIKNTINCQWFEDNEPILGKTYAEWIAAGKPTDRAQCHPFGR